MGEDKEQSVRTLVREFADPLLAEMGLELVEVEFRREGHGWVLRLFIDREGGVTLDDCAAVSREVDHYLDVEDPIDHRYHLEVSSPGLERPVRWERDFRRFTGQRARVKMMAKVDGQRVFTGELAGVEDGCVLVRTDRKTVRLPLDGVLRARLIDEPPAGEDRAG